MSHRDPQWYKDAVNYEVHVRAFADSNGDGRGEFQGLTAKLDYESEVSTWTRDPVADAWMQLGVDGMRLDAVLYLYDRDGTNNENLPENHAFLRALRAHVDANFAGRMLLAEANQWPEDAIAYFGDPAAGSFTGRDFVILDFEGEPARSLSERRLKRSPFRDVAGMLRSFHYAAYAKLFEEAAAGLVRREAVAELESWARYWERWVAASFLRSYLARARGASFLPAAREDLATLLDAYILEKALHELSDELSNRPDWVGIPLQGVLQLLGERREEAVVD